MKAKVTRKYVAYFAAAAVIVLAVALHIMLGREKPNTIIIYSDASSAADTSADDDEVKKNSIETKNADSSRRKNNSSVSQKKTSTTKQSTVTTSQKQTKTERTTKPPRTTAATSKPAEFPIDINKVSYDELLQINGIGDVTANAILQYRNSVGTIHDMDKLLEISGIGDATLILLKEHLYVSDTDKVVETAPTTTTAPPEATEASTEAVTEPPVTEPPVTETEPPPQRQEVDLNTASAEELSEKLLIDIELARQIVELRDTIEYFENYLELKYAKDMTDDILKEIRPYLIIK